MSVVVVGLAQEKRWVDCLDVGDYGICGSQPPRKRLFLRNSFF